MLASLDHSMWFHAPFRADEWLLYDTESTRTGSNRALCSGRIYREDGTLAVLASTHALGSTLGHGATLAALGTIIVAVAVGLDRVDFFLLGHRLFSFALFG